MYPDAANLVHGISEADDAIRRHTSALFWWTVIGFVAGVLLSSGVLLVVCTAVGSAAWVLRRRQIPWVGFALAVLLVAMTT